MQSNYKIKEELKEYINNKWYYNYVIETPYGFCKIKKYQWNVNFKADIRSALNPTEYWINMVKEIHGDKYDYSLVEYKKANSKVKIICKKHGEFVQLAGAHLKGYGCYHCKFNSMRMTLNEFIIKANKQHNFKFDYSLVEYKNNSTKVKIICPIHGIFEQTPAEHLKAKDCTICSGRCRDEKDFIHKANYIHNSIYDYTKCTYINASTKVVITCPVHGEFEQTPNSHLRKSGCPDCAKENFGWTEDLFKKRCDKNNNGLGIFYILRCFNDTEEFYKLGITSQSIKARFNSKQKMPYKYEILQEVVNNSNKLL